MGCRYVGDDDFYDEELSDDGTPDYYNGDEDDGFCGIMEMFHYHRCLEETNSWLRCIELTTAMRNALAKYHTRWKMLQEKPTCKANSRAYEAHREAHSRNIEANWIHLLQNGRNLE